MCCGGLSVYVTYPCIVADDVLVRCVPDVLLVRSPHLYCCVRTLRSTLFLNILYDDLLTKEVEDLLGYLPGYLIFSLWVKHVPQNIHVP